MIILGEVVTMLVSIQGTTLQIYLKRQCSKSQRQQVEVAERWSNSFLAFSEVVPTPIAVLKEVISKNLSRRKIGKQVKTWNLIKVHTKAETFALDLFDLED